MTNGIPALVRATARANAGRARPDHDNVRI